MRGVVENLSKLIGSLIILVLISSMSYKLQAKECHNNEPKIFDQKRLNMLEKVKKKLYLARENIISECFDMSIKLSKEGIDVLGKNYLSDGMIDDTGMKFSLARIEEKKNNLKLAATIYSGVLESRINQLQIRLGNGNCNYNLRY